MIGLVQCNPRDSKCFSALFEIESYIRLIVRWELRGNYGLSWKGVIPSRITEEINKRKKQELDLGCVDTNKTNLLSYLNLSELKDLLTNTDLWQGSFKAHWGAHDIVQADFKRLIAVRNKMAHFRSVSERDFRLVKRFLEDLSYRTSNYDTIRSLSKRINLDNFTDYSMKLYKIQFVKDIVEFIITFDAFKNNKASFYSLDNHWGIELHVKAGSIKAAEFSNFMDGNQKHLSVCRMGELGEKIELQISKIIAIQNVKEIIADAVKLCEDSTEGISSDDAIDLYKINIREEILPWSLNFPCACRADQYY